MCKMVSCNGDREEVRKGTSQFSKSGMDFLSEQCLSVNDVPDKTQYTYSRQEIGSCFTKENVSGSS